MTRRVARLALTLSVAGLSEMPDEHAAVGRAQRKNAELLEDDVRRRAEAEVGKNRAASLGRDESPRHRSYPGPMASYYSAEVTADGDIVLDNPTDRARFFEFGTEMHPITATGLIPSGQRRPPRGSRGRFTKGARRLRFPDASGNIVFPEDVIHPGQDANPIMLDTLVENLDEMADNLLDELAEEYGGRTGGGHA